MNVLGICSGRINGNTEIMMKEAFRAIEETCGAECKLVRIQEAEIKKMYRLRDLHDQSSERQF